jgi:agmatine deiminase
MVSKYRFLPPEWAVQQAVLLTWPHPESDWRPILAQVEPVFVAIGCAVSRHEALIVSCLNDAHCEYVEGLLKQGGADMSRVSLYPVPSNDSWVRDHGPITVMRSGLRVLLDYQFNGWGNKYEAGLDNRLSIRLHEMGAFGSLPMETLDLVLEGGSIEVDGRGTLLTTTECLLSPERNPQYSREALETRLRQQLGVERILWLEHGQLLGDDTDGHIDTLARFCDDHTIAYVSCEDASDPHYAPLKAMEAELQRFTDADGKPYRLVPLPLPAAQYDSEGLRLPATYANFLIINAAVLLPTYADPLDEIVATRLAQCFPQREIITIDARPLIRQFGSIHCVTMQLPAAMV